MMGASSVHIGQTAAKAWRLLGERLKNCPIKRLRFHESGVWKSMDFELDASRHEYEIATKIQ
jgi:hypothetical protein